jgi:hypothetical protein
MISANLLAALGQSGIDLAWLSMGLSTRVEVTQMTPHATYTLPKKAYALIPRSVSCTYFALGQTDCYPEVILRKCRPQKPARSRYVAE